MDDRFKESLEEKVYSSKNIDDLDQQIRLFYDELLLRRRDDVEEEGLQAAGVIYPDAFAAKICENNGKGTHQNSFVNLTKYLNGDNNYLSEAGTGYFMLYMDIMKQLQDSIQIRILSKEEELVLSITGSKPITNDFQLYTLKKLLIKAKEMNNNGFNSVIVGVALPNIYFEHTNISDEMISDIDKNKGTL